MADLTVSYQLSTLNGRQKRQRTNAILSSLRDLNIPNSKFPSVETLGYFQENALKHILGWLENRLS